MDHDNEQTSLHDENILALTLLRPEEILCFKLNTVSKALRLNKRFSCFASLWKILNDKFLDNWISKYPIISKLNTIMKLRIIYLVASEQQSVP